MGIFSQEEEMSSGDFKGFHIDNIVDQHCVLPDLGSGDGGSCTKTEFHFTDENFLKILLTSLRSELHAGECSGVGWLIIY